MIGREKLVMKHTRHASNPMGNEQSVNITQPGTIQHNIIETSKTRSKVQNTGVNQPSNQIGQHQRMNASKFGPSAANNSKHQKTNAISTSQISNNNTSGAYPGHKKSVSMANSKITQLLLKAGSKHYIAAAQQQMQNIVGANSQRGLKTGTQQQNLPQKNRANKGGQTGRQPTPQYEALTQDEKVQSGFVNIAKSHDFTNVPIQLQQHSIPTEEEQLQRILSLDQNDLININKAQQELSYQDQKRIQSGSSFYNVPQLPHKHNHQNVANKQKKQSQTIQANNPSSIDQQQHNQKRSQADGKQASSRSISKQPGNIHPQKQMIMAQFNMVGNQQVVQKGGAGQMEGVVMGKETKLASNKIITSGAGVKKPVGHIQQSSINKSGNQITIALHGQQHSHPLPGPHQRAKSDQIYGINKQSLQVGNPTGAVIQNQRGKVGQILKNNFIEAAGQQQPGGSKFIGFQQNAKILRSYGGGQVNQGMSVEQLNQNEMSQPQINTINQILSGSALNSKIGQGQLLQQAAHDRKKSQVHQHIPTQSSTSAQQHNQGIQIRKTTKEKYQELKTMYNDLLEKHQALAASKTDDNLSPGPVAPSSLPTQKNLPESKASLASLNNQGQPSSFQQQNQINNRVIRYLNNKQQMQGEDVSNATKRDLSGPPQSSQNIMVYPAAQQHKHKNLTQVEISPNESTDSAFNKFVHDNTKRKSQDTAGNHLQYRGHNRVSTHFYGQNSKEHFNIEQNDPHMRQSYDPVKTGEQQQYQIVMNLQSQNTPLTSEMQELARSTERSSGIPTAQGFAQEHIMSGQPIGKVKSIRQQQISNVVEPCITESEFTQQHVEKTGNHRRSVSDGNDPSQFKFNNHTGARHPLGQYSAQRQAEIQAAKNAELTSSEAGEGHHHPSQHQINLIEKSQGQILPRNDVKPTPTLSDLISGRQDMKKRVKSTSIRRSQNVKIENIQTSSIEPENEGYIQNPSNENTRKNFLNHHKPKESGKSNRSYDNQMLVNLDTKEQQVTSTLDPPTITKAPKGFHHPQLSHPNAWPMGSKAVNNSAMVIQENTPSSNSQLEQDDMHRVYPTQNSGKNGVYPSQHSHQERLLVERQSMSSSQQKKNSKSPQINNLLYSQKAAAHGSNGRTSKSGRAAGSLTAGERSNSNPREQSKQQAKSKHKSIQRPTQTKGGVSKDKVSLTRQRIKQQPSGHQKNKLSAEAKSEIVGDMDQAVRPAIVQMHDGGQKTALNAQTTATGGRLASVIHHKRVKSDAVERKEQNLLPSTGVLNQNMVISQKNLPRKMKATSIHQGAERSISVSPALDVREQPHQTDHLETHNFFDGQNRLDGGYGEDDKKLVNVSIDLIDPQREVLGEDSDDDGAERGQIRVNEESQWFEVKQDQKQSERAKQQTQQELVMQFQRGRVNSQTKRADQVNQKRKKFMLQQQAKSKEHASPTPGSGPIKGQKKRQVMKPQKFNNQTHQQHFGSTSIENDSRSATPESALPERYNQMLQMAKNKLKSKSEVPNHMLIKGSTSSFGEGDQAEQQAASKFHINSLKELQKYNFNDVQASSESLEFGRAIQGVPVDTDGSRKVSINMHIPSKISGFPKDQAVGGIQNAKHAKKQSSKQSLQPHPKVKYHEPAGAKNTTTPEAPKAKGLKTLEQPHAPPLPVDTSPGSHIMLGDNLRTPADANEMCAPLNSINFSADRASKSSNLKGMVVNNFVNNLHEGIQDRLETHDSIANDTSLAPREKLLRKLKRYIMSAFKNSQTVPPTTVEFYRIGKILGKGAFGKVNLALHQLTQKMVAIKSINKTYFSEASQTKKVMQEVLILKQTRHRSIVRLYEYFETQKHILFVIEICAGGDLLNYVRKRRQLKEDVAKSVFKQLINGIAYCHSKSILHRDIKLDNILLSANGEVKICDFGVSKVVKRGEIMTEQCGTPAYIAPEILADRGYEGFAVDIWSAGVVLYAMLYGVVPFRANNMSELQKLIIKAKYSLQDCISKDARDLLSGLLEREPSKRLTIRQILAHPWLADAADTVELFTQAEKNYIRSEYTYNDTARYNRNTGEETKDDFIDAMLDTNENSILKNAETKSIILAPFNSTKSNVETDDQILDEIKDMLHEKGIIKFAPRVREIDMQYEVNNNAELDNGVYHDFGKEEDKKEDEIKKEGSVDSKGRKKDKQTELQMLDNMIKAQESACNFTAGSGVLDSEPNPDTEPAELKPYEAEDEEGIPNTKQLKANSSKKFTDFNELNEAKDSLAPGLQVSSFGGRMLQTAGTLIIDERYLDKVVEYGYPRDATVRYLNNNELNSATTAYYLLTNPDQQPDGQNQLNQKGLEAALGVVAQI